METIPKSRNARRCSLVPKVLTRSPNWMASCIANGFPPTPGCGPWPLRFFNVFGPRQLPEGSYGAAVPLFIRRALQNEPITIFGDGGQTRDFVYVEDIASALRFAAQNDRMRGVFNCGYG